MLSVVTWLLLGDECWLAARAVQRSRDAINTLGLSVCAIILPVVSSKNKTHSLIYPVSHLCSSMIRLFWSQNNSTSGACIREPTNLTQPCERLSWYYWSEGVFGGIAITRSAGGVGWKTSSCCRRCITDTPLSDRRTDGGPGGFGEAWMATTFPKRKPCPWDNLYAKCVLENRTRVCRKLDVGSHGGSFCDRFFGGRSWFIGCSHGRGQPRYDSLSRFIPVICCHFPNQKTCASASSVWWW